jgi:GPH family glycoside/pentoside/hexuronide:cation symporter
MTKPGWQLTRAQRSTYSVGMFSSALVTANVLAWVLYFYAPPPNAVDGGMIFLGAGVAIGLARIIGSLVDAFTNPLVAFWSDRSTNPRGRRAPFILRGTLPLAIFAILIWFPPVRGVSTWNVVWLAVTLSGTWFFYTYVVAPYLALMPELSSNPEERVSLTVTMSYWEAGASVIAALAVPPIIEALKGGVQLGPLFLADGFKVTAIVLAVLGALGFFVSVSRIREKPLAEERRTKFSLVRSVVECFRNPAFLPYLIAVFAAKIGIGLVMISLPFLTTAVLHKGEGFTAVLLAPLFLATIIGFVVAQVLVNRVGLKKAFRFATLAATLLVAGFVGIYFLGGKGLPVQRFDQLPDGDVRLVFAATPAAADAALSGGAGGAGAAAAPLVRQGDAAIVRLSALEWQGLFADVDEAAFDERVGALDDAALRALLRPDLPPDVDPPGADAKTWLADLDAATLTRVLAPAAAPLLFKPDKRRYEEELFLGAPKLAAPLAPGQPVRLALTVGLLENPEETVNLDGWRVLFLSREERAALGAAVRPAVLHEEPVVLEGQLELADGSLLFAGFRPVEGGALGPAAAKLLEDPTRLDYLVSRFDLRREYEFSARIWLALALCFFLGFPAAILMSMYRPIVCEIVDLDEQRVGTRREAMYFGVEGLLTKGADGVSAILAPAVMIAGHLVLPPPFGYVLPFAAGAVFMFLGYLVFGRYPLGQAGGAKLSEALPADPRAAHAGRN